MIVEAGKSEIYSRSQQFGNLRVGIADLSLWNLQGRTGRLETEAGFLCCSPETEFLLLQEISVFALKAFNWLGEAHHIMEGYLLYLKSTD